jgi:hypothetical protein
MTEEVKTATIADMLREYNDVLVPRAKELGQTIYRPRASFKDRADGERSLEKIRSSIRAGEQAQAGPGLARLRAHPKAEEIRQSVLADQARAVADAARAPVGGSPGPEAPPSKTKASRARDRAAPASHGDTPKPKAKRRTKWGWDPTDIVRVVVEGNPRTGKAKDRFEKVRDGMTVAEMIRATGRKKDVRGCLKRGLIRLEPVAT